MKLTPVLFALALLCTRPAAATPAEAAALGGLDLYFPGQMDTFSFFSTDLNIYINPALAFWYTNQAQINLGFNSSLLSSSVPSGAGVQPHGLLLASVSDSVTLGFGLNRHPMLYTQQNSLRSVLGTLLPGSNGFLGQGAYLDPVYSAGLGLEHQSVPLAPALDLFAAFAAGYTMFGLNAYMAFGQALDENQTLTGSIEDNDTWTWDQNKSASSWVTLTAGFAHDGQSFRPEVWLRYTGVSAWTDVQSFGPAAIDAWTQGDVLDDHTVGLKGTSRLGLGFRGTILGSATEITPLISFDTATGKTFAAYRLFNNPEDPIEGPIAQAEDDEIKASSQELTFGAGITWFPMDEMRIIVVVSGHLTHSSLLYDNHAEALELPNTLRAQTKYQTTYLALPVVSIGAEYFPFGVLGIRGSIRSSTLLVRSFSKTEGFTGDIMGAPDGSELWVANLTQSGKGSYDRFPAPTLSVGIGPSFRLKRLTLDTVFGGQIIGDTDNSFFSRLDLKVDWN